VQVQQVHRLPALHDELRQLSGVLTRLRTRLGLERLAAFALRGLVVGAAAICGLSVAAWISGDRTLASPQTTLAGLATPVLIAVAVALGAWPSRRQTALTADRRLGLDERLGTAVELAERTHRSRAEPRRFDRLQILDAVAHARAAPRGWLALNRRTRTEALLALLAVVLALGSTFLPTVPRPSLARASDSSAQDLDAASAAAALDGSAITDAIPIEVDDSHVSAQPPQSADPNLASVVQQQQAQRSALDQLSAALAQISAGQPTADAIQRGDFAQATDQLSSLADDADQLSDAAKQQLAQALQQAANATAATDRQLADRERAASQALNRGTYQDQRQSLRSLADQIAASGARAAPSDQLAREVGQLQQQGSGQSIGQGQNGRGQSTQPGPGRGAQDPGPPAAGSQGQGDGSGQGGSGAGTGAGPDPLGDPSQRLLDASGQNVSVPTELGNGSGVRPPDGSEDQTGTNPSAGPRAVSEAVQAQQTGQVAPERNLVPGDQRPVVRGYFR
jgi:hypothetical protein